MFSGILPGYRIREHSEVEEAVATLEWYRESHPEQVAEVERQVPKPAAWSHYDHRGDWAEYYNAKRLAVAEACQRYVRAIRDRFGRLYDRHIAAYGDRWLMRVVLPDRTVKHMGSLEEFVDAIKADHAAGRCPCALRRRMAERARQRDAVLELVSSESFADQLDEAIDELAGKTQTQVA